MKMESNASRLAAAMLIAFTVACFLFSAVNTENDPVFGIDFLPYHLAGQFLAEGNPGPLTDYVETGGFMATKGPFLDAFHQEFFPESKAATRWVYLSAYAWIFRPLASMDFPTAARIWLVFNSLLCLASVLLLWDTRCRTCPLDVSGSWRFAWYLFIGLTFQPVFSNLMHGQVTGLIVFGFCLGYWLLRRGRPFAAGLAFGLIAPLKFYPAVIVLYFLCRRKWRVVSGAIVGGLALLLISLATVGWSGNVEYARLILSEMHQGGMAAFNNESLNGFLLHAFTMGNVNTWQDMTVPLWLTLLRIGLTLGLLTGVVWTMRRRPAGEGAESSCRDLDLALVVMVMLIITPITWYHYYMWMLFPLFVVFDQLLAMRTLTRKYLIWFALAYGLTAVEGIYAIRPFDAQALQQVEFLRVMLSQSFFGALLLTALIVDLRGKKTMNDECGTMKKS